MLKSLYDYGIRHADEGVPTGHAYRTLNFIIDMTGQGQYIGIRKGPKEKVLAQTVLGISGTTPKSNVLLDKASTVLGLFDGTMNANQQALALQKHECFTEYLENGKPDVTEFGPVLELLSDKARIEHVKADLTQADCKSASFVTFAVDGKLLIELQSVRNWWSKHETPPADAAPTAIDVITGKPCVAQRLIPQCDQNSLGGGHASGAAWLSFNFPSGTSYGLADEQGMNCPLDVKTSTAINSAITVLSRNAPKIGGIKFMHWYDVDVPPEQDPIVSSLFDVGYDIAIAQDTDAESEAVMTAIAKDSIQSPITGKPAPSLAGKNYHIMLMIPANKRIVFPSYAHGPYDRLQANIDAWFSDTAVVNATGTGLMKPMSLNKMLYRLLTKAERDKKLKNESRFAPLSPWMSDILAACIDNKRVPAAILTRAMNAMRSNLFHDEDIHPATMQWIKLWLMRRNRHAAGNKITGVDDIMPGLNPECTNMGYICGRLMATYEAIQKFVSPDVNAGVLAKYYTACSRAPAQTIGVLQSLSVHHFEKFKGYTYRNFYESALAEVYGCAGTEIPEKLDQTGQAYFALGYWHQKADLTLRKNALTAEIKAAKAAKNDTSETEED